MRVSELKDRLGLSAAVSGADNEVTGCYIGDLMSLAMAKLQEGNVWITIQTNVNAVAVAVLKEAACIITADGFILDDTALKKAESEEVTVFTSEKSAYELAKLLGELGI